MASPVDFVLDVVRSLAEKPDAVSAKWVEGPDGNQVEIRLADEDRGRIIGRRGQNIRSLRQLVSAVFGTKDKSVGVELVK